MYCTLKACGGLAGALVPQVPVIVFDLVALEELPKLVLERNARVALATRAALASETQGGARSASLPWAILPGTFGAESQCGPGPGGGCFYATVSSDPVRSRPLEKAVSAPPLGTRTARPQFPFFYS